MAIEFITLTPLDVGKEVSVTSGVRTGTGTSEYRLSCDATAILVSLYVKSTSGDVDVSVDTSGTLEGPQAETAGARSQIIKFDTVSAPTTELLLRKSAVSLRKIRVVVTHSDDCEIEVRVRGIEMGEVSTKILGAGAASAGSVSIPDGVATLLIPSALTDRAGIVAKHWGEGDGKTNGVYLYIGFTAAEATPALGYPLGFQEALAMDLAAGVDVYVYSDGEVTDVRILEAGG